MKNFIGMLLILAIGFFMVNLAFAGQQGSIVDKGEDTQKRPHARSQESSQRNSRAVIDPHESPQAVIDPHDSTGTVDQGQLRRDQARETVQSRTSEDSEIESMELNNVQSKRQQSMQHTSQTIKSTNETQKGIIKNIGK